MSVLSIADMKRKIQDFPKRNLIPLPTPMQKLENLSSTLGGPDIYIKRDDLTGLAFGGNKSRKLEFIIQDALDKNADAIITWAAVQSNWCLQTAAVARKFGIKPILLLFKTYALPEEHDGNLLLDLILDADIRIKDAEEGKVLRLEDVKETIDEVVSEVKALGYTPYVAPIGGSMVGGSMEKPLGAISYVNAFAEILEQAEERGIEIDAVLHATGSGSTQAGIAVGAKSMKEETKILGISVSDDTELVKKEILSIAHDTTQSLDLGIVVEKGDLIVLDEYIQEGYGVLNRDVAEAVRLMSEKEGIFLDPVYTGKAMVALIDLAKKGYFRKGQNVLFVHTGGTPALFPNKHKLVDFLKT